MVKPHIPDLTFPIVQYGKNEKPLDLVILLNPDDRSGASLKRRELVTKLHEEINGDLVGGGSELTARGRISALRIFFAWADANGYPLRLSTVADSFKNWADFMIHTQRTTGNVE